MFGAGGGTSSYEEIETTDLIILWGSNARNAHPIFFHHLLKGVENGAKMYVVDPRRTSSAKFADTWLGLNVGSDVALANGVAREIIAAGLHNVAFIEHATSGFDAFAASVESYTLEHTEALTGVPAVAIAELAHAYASAPSAQLMWTLGITEHHNAVDNVLSLCNLALLTGHIGQWGSGLVPLRGQNNVQGGGDMGALPDKLPGFQNIDDATARAKFEAVYGQELNPKPGMHLSLMFEAMDRGEMHALYILGENPADSEADIERARRLLREVDMVVVQDIFMTRTAELADVVLPAAVAWAETDGTSTSSERRVQRVRKALDPPGQAKDDLEILALLAERLGVSWGRPTAEELWDELRTLSPMHQGMSYVRLEAENGLQWPCPDLEHPGSPFLHSWLWADDLDGRQPAPFSPVVAQESIDALSEEYPLRLTTGRALDSYNTGVQSDGFESPIREGHTLDMCATDIASLGLVDGQRAKVSSRRGSIEMTVREQDLPVGLTFTTPHFADIADVNVLTSDAWDKQSGTAPFKATAIRVEPVSEALSA